MRSFIEGRWAVWKGVNAALKINHYLYGQALLCRRTNRMLHTYTLFIPLRSSSPRSAITLAWRNPPRSISTAYFRGRFGQSLSV